MIASPFVVPPLGGLPFRRCRSRLWSLLVIALFLGLSTSPAAAQMGGADPRKSVDSQMQVLEERLAGETDEDKEACRRAAQTLGEMGPKAADAVDLLTRAMESRSVEVRHFAVDALGRIGPAAKRSVPAIIEQVDIPADSVNYKALAFFRRLAARALGRIGPSAAAAVPVLEKSLQNEDPVYRVRVAVALWRIAQHESALPAITAVIQGDSPQASYVGVTALLELGDAAKPAIPLLVKTLANKDPDRCRAAAHVLESLGVDVLVPLARLLQQPNVPHPSAAIYLLGRQLSRKRKSVLENHQLDAAGFAAASRGAICEAAPALIRRLSDPDDEVRQNAIAALSEMGVTAGLLLVTVLDTGAPRERNAAIEIFERLERTLPSESPDSEGQSADSEGMALIKSRLLPKLIELAEHPEPSVRTAAFRALARLSFGAELESARPTLRAALRDDIVLLRRYAFEALDQLREP